MKRCLSEVLASGLACAAIAAPAAEVEQRIRQFERGLLPAVLVAGEKPAVKSLTHRMTELSVPAVSIAVIHHGRLDWARAYGVTQSKGIAVTPDTLFQAASISKPVFALAVLQLVERGKLDLDTNVNDYLKSWRVPDNEFTRHEKVTLRRLLSHSAGVTVQGFSGYSPHSQLPTTPQILDGTYPANTRAVRVDTVPGSTHRYSGGGYTVAQLVLSDQVDRPLDRYLDEAILRPLGMRHSTFAQPLPAARLREAAQPHLRDGSAMTGAPLVYPELAAAGMWTTPTDLARFGLGLHEALEGRSSLVSAATARTMLTPVISRQALGPMVDGSTSRKYFLHGGGNAGYPCMWFAYEDGDGFAIMTNSDNASELISEVWRTLAHLYQWPDFAPPVRERAKVSRENLERMLGVYELSDGSVFVVRKEGDRLLGQAPGAAPLTLLPQSDHELFARELDLVVTFAMGESGAVASLTHVSETWRRTGKPVDSSRAKNVLASVEAAEKRFRGQKPHVSSEARIRRLFPGLASGKPDHEELTPRLAELMRQEMQRLQDLFTARGNVVKIAFKRVDPGGVDVFEVAFERETVQVDVQLDESGRIDVLRY